MSQLSRKVSGSESDGAMSFNFQLSKSFWPDPYHIPLLFSILLRLDFAQISHF